MRHRATAYLVATVVIAAAAWLLWPARHPMPEVTFNLVDGRRIDSGELRGRPLLVNFWSVGCEVCLRDMPHLSRLQDSLGRERLTVLGVAMPHDPPPAVMALVNRLQPGYAVALDVHGEISRAFGGVQVTPTNVLIDPAGNISFTARGPVDEARIRATLLTFSPAPAG